MSSAVDDDIRADFLVEAGELMQKLGEQLVELEQRPDDRELLNSVFRAFHTVKGGAGFLQIAPMVELCHAAEEVFGVVRSGARAVDADLMDATMQSVDQLQTMLDQIGAGNEATSAPPELIVALRQGAQGPAEAKAAAPAPEAAKPKAKAKSKAKSKAAAEKAPTAAQSNTITDDEFEALLDQLNGGGPPGIAAPAAAAAPAQSNTITDDEFEALLDQLNGGGPPGVDTSAATPPAAPKAAPAQVTPHKVPAAAAPAAASAAPAAETTLRVDTQRLDLMMNLIGELVLVRNRLKTLRGSGAPPEAYAKSVGELDHITRSLQSAVMRIRMQPLKKV
ncbi:MAG: Hpt domain-containing protein, partial [Nevskia sp.]|nr:Hpt domain-containing protein [Nevskia sp.]